ncbi:MAG: hypothetical protein NVS3B25_35450 [Hymenobacter sp.]
MRYLFASALSLLMLAAGCKKTNPTIANLNGTYSGTFQRQVGGAGQISQVRLVFSGGNWTGSSQTPKYPGLCNGTYSIASNSKAIFYQCLRLDCRF